MRIWIDTEFNEFRGALISMALIDEAGREFYRSLGCENPGEWVSQHVMPIIGIESVTMADFQRDLQLWLAAYDSVHLIADWPEDIEHFCRALITGPGQRISTPRLSMEVDRDICAPSALPHNALEDVRGIRRQALALAAD